MKIKNIILTGVAALSMAACNDYLEVEAPSAYTEDFVFNMKTEVQRALYGVYAQALDGNLYGNYYQRVFILNSDVDMIVASSNSHSHSSYSRFDCDDQGSEIYKFWTAAYRLIEYTNKFITAAEASDLRYTKDNDGNYETDAAGNRKLDADMMQWIGEAKCLRAMAYHDMVVMFGDVPFTFEPASVHGSDYVPPIVDREEIQQKLIDDLKQAAPYMSSAAGVTVEHCSKEFAQGLIARIALTAGGYSLRPDKSNPKNYGTMKRPDNYRDFYQTAMLYADSVILAGNHRLLATYQDVFVNECNYQVVNNDDPIFEIPFAKEATGNVGYIQGPTYSAYGGKTVGPWGECSGNGRLNAFYRFLFREGDKRREFVNGLWYYSYYTTPDGALADTVYIRQDYTVHNNKWSKLWTSESSALGDITTGSTGINYPYMRYADVLLMYAEAANELNGGPTDKAVECLTTVHQRAFDDGDPQFIADAKASKEAFQKAVMDERKWEFAGENMRWRDLVRTNTYGEELVYSFLRYYSVGMQNAGSPSGYEDAINLHDGYTTDAGYIDNLPERIYYHQYNIEEANAYGLRMYKAQLYGYHIDEGGNVTQKYPNQSLKSLRIYNAYKPMSQPVTSAITRGGFSATAWNFADFYQWGDQNSGTPKNECKYSYYGYIRCDDNGNLWLINNGTQTAFPSTIPAASELPAVRYLLPYPNLAIQRSAGAYQNYYGY
ncbi:MAG: RagB/SusD family nutrient uptake outer membrane protein [Prevotella sp.]|nr:RagB/SusD family nutrient uptake outer membrane protein [Prevotella sp.]